MTSKSDFKIYVASSWRNESQQEVVRRLREAGYTVYDFKNPKPGNNGFAWKSIDPDWQAWTPEQYRAALDHPLAVAGYASDFGAMEDCHACVFVQPCGVSAAMELGWCVGAGKFCVALLAAGREPDLMIKMADELVLSLEDAVEALDGFYEEWIDESEFDGDDE